MTAERHIDCILWDFSGTLVREGWELTPLHAVEQWVEAWQDVASQYGAAWDRGEINGHEFAARVGARLALSPSEVLSRVATCADRISFFDLPWRVAQKCRLPQALVTVIPDIFSWFVVPKYRLDQLFDVIVTSWQERTLDKVRLCRVAVDRLGCQRALLIDNVEENVRSWSATGGQSYWFRCEEQFREDLRSELRFLRQATVSCEDADG